MARIVVSSLEDEVKERLRQRARRHGKSTEEEVRDILEPLQREVGLGSRIASRFHKIGLVRAIPELLGQPARPASLDE